MIRMKLITGIILILSTAGVGICQDVLDEDREVYLKLNEPVQLDCRLKDVSIEDYVLKYSVVWSKLQNFNNASSRVLLNSGEVPVPTSIKEATELGLEGNINIFLKIKGARLEDSGEYRCEAYKNGEKLGEVVYRVFVLGEISEVMLYGDRDVVDDPDTWSHQSELELSSQNENYLACAGKGNYPTILTVSIGGRPITGTLTDHSDKYELEGRVPGDQIMHVVRTIASDSFKARVDEDGSVVRCQASIEDDNQKVLASKEVSSTLMLRGAPRFMNCSKEVYVPKGRENFQLVCEFFAKPAASNIVWYGETSADTVTRSGGPKNGLTSSMQPKPGSTNWFAILQIDTVDYQHFQLYKLTVTNSEGSAEEYIQLREGKEDDQGATTGSSCAGVSLVLTLLMCVLSLLHL